MPLAFLKMHALGNDFVVIDARAGAVPLSPAAIAAIADRRRGVGCDQLIRLEPSRRGDLFMRIWNGDGSEAEACGNAARCIAMLAMDESGREQVRVETVAGLLAARRAGDGDGAIRVDMGPARCGWRQIPLAREADTGAVDLGPAAPAPAVCVNIGNPHAVLFVADCDRVALAATGRKLERHPLFPQGANISFCTVESPARIRARVWERGAGATPACGSAACAIAVAAARRGLSGRRVAVALPGGELALAWQNDGHVAMTGPATLAYAGTLAAPLPS